MEKQTEKENKKDRIGYGVKIPPLTFEEAIQAIKSVSELGGEKANLDALATVLKHSRSSSNFSYKLSALKSFGLITADKSNYQLTDLGKRIVTPISVADEMRAIHEAFCNNETLNKIWTEYKTKMLPQREYLANYLETSLHIPSSLKIGWADYFIGAANVSKLLIVRGDSGGYRVLSEPLSIPPIKEEEQKPSEVGEKSSQQINPQNTNKQDSIVDLTDSMKWGNIHKPLLSNGKVAIFAIPNELSQQDIDKLRVVIKGIDTGLDGLKRDE